MRIEARRRLPGWIIRLGCILIGLIASFGTGHCEPQPQQASKPRLPNLRPPLVDRWLPRDWWTPERVASGRLNNDPYDDLAIVVQRRVDAPEDAAFPRGSRALFVLFSDARGRWRRGALVPGLLPCSDCTSALGGTIGSALSTLEISDDGVLEVGWVERDRVTKAVRLLIAWDHTYKELGLYQDDISIIPAQGKRSRVRRDYRAGRIWVNDVVQDMPARFIPIEDISADQY